MKAIRRRDFIEIQFEESEKYAGKTLYIDGQNGLNKDFYILPKPKMYWVDTVKHKCTHVDTSEYNDILAYSLNKIKDTECSILVYNR